MIQSRIERIGLSLRPGIDFELVNPASDERFRALWNEYHRIMGRKGITPDVAKYRMRSNNTLISAMLLRNGDADAMVCGMVGQHAYHLKFIEDVIGLAPGVRTFATMNLLMLSHRTLFLCDTYVNENPDAETIAEITLMAAEAVRNFGLTPKVALLSHSNFGSVQSEAARKMSRARALLEQMDPNLEVDGEMHPDAALKPEIRDRIFPGCRLQGEANLLVMPNIDAANIAFNLIKATSGQGASVGPILLGSASPVHILTETASVRRLVNMTALAVVDANQ